MQPNHTIEPNPDQSLSPQQLDSPDIKVVQPASSSTPADQDTKPQIPINQTSSVGSDNDALSPVTPQAVHPQNQSGLIPKDIEAQDNTKNRKNLIKIISVVVSAALVLIVGGFLIHKSFSNSITTKTITNGGYTYNFKFYNRAKTNSIEGTQIVGYKDGNEVVSANAIPTAQALRSSCRISSTDSQVFKVDLYGVEEPVCLTAGDVRGTNIQAFSVYFKANGHNQEFLIIYSNDNQPTSAYSTLKKIFNSIQVS